MKPLKLATLAIALTAFLPAIGSCLEEPLLMQLLSSKQETSDKARSILKRLSKYSQAELTPYLVFGLQDAESGVRKNAILALATIGPDSIRVGRALQQALKDQNLEVRELALSALHRKPLELNQANMMGSIHQLFTQLIKSIRTFAR